MNYFKVYYLNKLCCPPSWIPFDLISCDFLSHDRTYFLCSNNNSKIVKMVPMNMVLEIIDLN